MHFFISLIQMHVLPNHPKTKKFFVNTVKVAKTDKRGFLVSFSIDDNGLIEYCWS